MLHRREIVGQLLSPRPENLLVVTGLGSPTWDVVAAADDPNNFNFMGAMGQAAPFALGLAIAQPERRVLLITGDGELLMALGSLAAIANVAPANLGILVLDNEAYAETGAQPTATSGSTDLAEVALACGFREAVTVTSADEVAGLSALVLEQPGPVLGVAKVAVEKLPMTFPYSFDGVTSINRFREAVLR